MHHQRSSASPDPGGWRYHGQQRPPFAVVPIYKGSFGRKMGSVLTPLGWRDVLIHGSEDLGRTIDYLETRPDIDARRLAYYGLSSGAAVNGRHDFFFPFETNQAPMFKLLGTSDKKQEVFESGHVPNEWQEVMKEILDWLDGHLGPVGRADSR